MMTPDDIDVWVGLDVGKSAHHAHALDHDGNTLYDKPLKQDEKAILFCFNVCSTGSAVFFRSVG